MNRATIVALVVTTIVLTVHCTNYSKFTDEQLTRFNNFIAECHHSHASAPYPNPKVIVKEAPGMGYGTFATQDISAEDIYIFLPLDCVMHEAKARQVLGDFAQGMDDFHALLFYLLKEKSMGDKSFFFPYIDTLPVVFDTPYYWEDRELGMLKGSEAVDMVKDERFEMKEKYDYVTQKFIKTDLGAKFCQPESAFSYENYEWATNTMNSRTIWLIGMNNKRSLVPLLDMVNYKEGPNPQRRHVSARNMTLNAVVTRAPWSFKKGEQVFENYGSDNYVNFLNHGFTYVDSTYDCVKVRVDYTGTDSRILTELANDRVSPKGDIVCLKSLNVFIPEHLKRKLALIARYESIAEPMSILYKMIEDKLASYPTTLEQDANLLKTTGLLSVRGRSAVTFVHEEKKQLKRLLKYLKKEYKF